MKIDIHTHILPAEIPDWKKQFGYGGFIKLQACPDCATDLDMVRDDGVFFRRIQKNCVDADVRVSECKTHGVQVQVLSTVPTMFNYHIKANDNLVVAKFLNDHIAEIVKKDPKKFVGLATVPLQDPKLSVGEVERCMKIGFKGFQIGSHINDWNLSDPALYPFYEACEATGAALFVHPWDMRGQDKMQKYWLPWLVGMPMESSLAICSMIFGGIFEKFPKLRVAFAHGGGSFPFTLGRIQHGFEARPDLCAVDNTKDPMKYIGKFFVDSLVHDERALRYLVDLFGKEKVCLGTDYPFPLGELEPGQLIAKTFEDQETQDWLNYKTALNWLNMKESDFV